MQELISFIVKSVVSNKDAVQVEVVKEDRFTLYNVSVDSSDIGAVIGKSGKIAEAIRTVAKSASGRERLRIKFESK